MFKKIIIGLVLSIGLTNMASAVNKETTKLEYKDFEFTYDKEAFKTVNAPVFSTSSNVIYQPLVESKKDDRFKNVTNALNLHEKEKPKDWDELVMKVMLEDDELTQLKLVNNIINKIPYKDGTDGSYYHPAKLFKKGGVCKDFVMAKYLLLKESGYDVSKMRIAVLTPKAGKPDSPFHVVLVASANNKDYVLDLKPAYLAEQERAKLKISKDKQIKQIREAGLDVEDSDLMDQKGFYSLSKYVSERGLVWAGNEFGSRERFTPPKQVVKSKKKR